MRGLRFTPTTPGRPKRVGVKKDGSGRESADVALEIDPVAWLTRAATGELAAVGISPEVDAPDRPTISIAVRQFFVEPKVEPWSQTVMAATCLTVRVIFPDGRAYERRFVGEFVKPDLFLIDRDYEQALVESARKAMVAAAKSTRALLDAGGLDDG